MALALAASTKGAISTKPISRQLRPERLIRFVVFLVFFLHSEKKWTINTKKRTQTEGPCNAPAKDSR